MSTFALTGIVDSIDRSYYSKHIVIRIMDSLNGKIDSTSDILKRECDSHPGKQPYVLCKKSTKQNIKGIFYVKVQDEEWLNIADRLKRKKVKVIVKKYIYDSLGCLDEGPSRGVELHLISIEALGRRNPV